MHQSWSAVDQLRSHSRKNEDHHAYSLTTILFHRYKGISAMHESSYRHSHWSSHLKRRILESNRQLAAQGNETSRGRSPETHQNASQLSFTWCQDFIVPNFSNAGCIPSTWLGKASWSAYNAEVSFPSLEACADNCYSNIKCKFIRWNATTSICSLRGSPNVTDGNAPNSTVSSLCFPRGNCEFRLSFSP